MAIDTDRAYRDSSGRTLADYPRPSVAVDTALLTVAAGSAELYVLLVRREDVRGWRLPGTFLHEGERLIDAVHRSLAVKAGVKGTQPEQLHVFDDPKRDDRGWVLSVAHFDVVRAAQLDRRDAKLTRMVPVGRPGRLPYGHNGIIDRAVAAIRAEYAERPDPRGLIDDPFTVLDLRSVHEAVAGRPLQRDTFRRQMEPHLVGTGTTTSGTRGKPAQLFRRRPNLDDRA